MEVNCSSEMARATVSLNNNNINNDSNNNNARWNPTKEQINILENLYREGLRTPSAEQIQQITSRLKAYGHIEGKNVFYWFQNHKARQRQKQKQESFAYLNRYIHHSAVAAAQCPAVVYPPIQPNGFYGPYFIPQGEAPMGLYPQYPKVLVPGPYKRKLRRERVIEKARVTSFTAPAHDHHQINQYSTFNSKSCNINGHETLDLFPLHPTGILDDQVRAMPSDGENSSASESSFAGFDQRPFIDFFN